MQSTMKVTITRSGGYLRIDPIIPDLLAKLSFSYTVRDKIKKKFFDQKTGKMREVFVDGPIGSVKKNLYKITKDGNGVITYDGLLTLVKKTLFKLKYEIDILEPNGAIYEEPEITERVFEGLYPDQKTAVEAVLSHDGGCLVNAATNTGKTRIIAALCRAFSKHRGLVVTNRQSVATKLYKDLQDLAPECDPGVYLSSKKAKGRTMVITSKSLQKFDPSNISYILFDEAHSASSPVTSEQLLRFKTSKKCGFSGTLSGGFKGLSKYLESVFGPTVFTLTDQELEEMERATPLHVYTIKVDKGVQFSKTTQNLTMEKNGVWYNRHRNKLLSECVNLVPKDQQLVIYVRTLAHLEELMSDYLKDSGFEIYHGSISTKEKIRVMGGFNSGDMKRIISTDCLAEGVDPKALFVTINANWTQSDVSVLQKDGRNRRLTEGKGYGVVIDFNDMWCERMQRKSKTRIDLYKSRGYKLFEDVSPDQIQFLQDAT